MNFLRTKRAQITIKRQSGQPESSKLDKTVNCPELSLSAQGYRLERSTPISFVDFDNVFERLSDLREFN